jgi:Uma2 family endonuclease
VVRSGKMSTPAHRPATYEDLLRVPDHLVAEIIDGDLYTSPRPALRHAVSSSVLGGDLNAAYQRGRGGPGGWWILDEPELHLGSNVLVPDLAGWRRERLPRIPVADAFATLAPDWVCEVLSPSTYRLDRVKKLHVYAREGVAHAWLVHPGERTLEILRLRGGRWVIVTTHGGDARVRAEPFQAVTIDLLELWGEERPRARRKARTGRKVARKRPARPRPRSR